MDSVQACWAACLDAYPSDDEDEYLFCAGWNKRTDAYSRGTCTCSGAQFDGLFDDGCIADGGNQDLAVRRGFTGSPYYGNYYELCGCEESSLEGQCLDEFRWRRMPFWATSCPSDVLEAWETCAEAYDGVKTFDRHVGRDDDDGDDDDYYMYCKPTTESECAGITDLSWQQSAGLRRACGSQGVAMVKCFLDYYCTGAADYGPYCVGTDNSKGGSLSNGALIGIIFGSTVGGLALIYIARRNAKTPNEAYGSVTDPQPVVAQVVMGGGVEMTEKARFDQNTGQPLTPQPRFDTMTDQPLPPQPRFDTMTGQPLTPQWRFDPVTGQPLSAAAPPVPPSNQFDALPSANAFDVAPPPPAVPIAPPPPAANAGFDNSCDTPEAEPSSATSTSTT